MAQENHEPGHVDKFSVRNKESTDNQAEIQET